MLEGARSDSPAGQRRHEAVPLMSSDVRSRRVVRCEMSLDAADKVCDVIAEFYGNKNARNTRD
jgi:ribosome biogenesis SPOUT family RNA methylase Rps3